MKRIALEDFEAPEKNYVGVRDILTRSLARYRFVTPYLRGCMLEVGCGRGYGFELTMPSTTWQVGADVSFKFLSDARKNYTTLPFVQVTGSALAFAAQSFDSIVAFEVIEHIHDDWAFLQAMKTVARPDAMIAVSTPNKYRVSGNADRPLNPFHVREYTASEFTLLLQRAFSRVALFGQTERTYNQKTANRLIDRIPLRIKYLLPPHIQSLFSTLLRPPLKIQDCVFEENELEHAHTFVALCRL